MGPLLGYEVLTAFFLEATFLGIMLFGWKRVPNLHVSSRPAGRARHLDLGFLDPLRQQLDADAGRLHALLATASPIPSLVRRHLQPELPLSLRAYVHGGLPDDLASSCWRRRPLLPARALSEAAWPDHARHGWPTIWLAPLQLLLGDQHGLNTLEISAGQDRRDRSALGDRQATAARSCSRSPTRTQRRNHFEIAIPHLGSLILTHEWDGEFKGLKDFKPEDRPPILPVFFAFRVMVGIGVLMIAIGVDRCLMLWLRGRLFRRRWFLQPMTYVWPLGFIAVLAGWFTAEVGRQPWTVYGMLRTADAVSPVPAAAVLTSLILFVLVYGVVFSTGIYYIAKLDASSGPDETPPVPEEGDADRAHGQWPQRATHDARPPRR